MPVEVRKIARWRVFLVLGYRKSGMLNICFDLTAVDLAKPNLTETLAHEQLGSSDMIGRQCSVRRSLRHAHRIASQISDIATVPVTTANAANIPDVVAQKRDDEMQPIVWRDAANADVPAAQNLLPDQRDHNGVIYIMVGRIAAGNVLEREPGHKTNDAGIARL